MPNYIPMPDAVEHTCWLDEENYDGLVSVGVDNGCAGCEQAAQYPCRWCGYGACFTTHSPEAHRANGDPDGPSDDVGPEWTDVPHVSPDYQPIPRLKRPDMEMVEAVLDDPSHRALYLTVFNEWAISADLVLEIAAVLERFGYGETAKYIVHEVEEIAAWKAQVRAAEVSA